MIHTLIKGPEVRKIEFPNGVYVSKVFSSVSTNDNHIYRHLIQNGYSTNPNPVFHHHSPRPQIQPTESQPVFATPSAPPLPTSASQKHSPKTTTPSRFGVTLEEIQAQKQKIQEFDCPPGTKRQGLKCLPASEFMAQMAKNE